MLTRAFVDRHRPRPVLDPTPHGDRQTDWRCQKCGDRTTTGRARRCTSTPRCCGGGIGRRWSRHSHKDGSSWASRPGAAGSGHGRDRAGEGDVDRGALRAAALLASRLGLGDGVVAALRHGFERWDGMGHPCGLADEAIPLPTRIAVVARDVELWARHGGFPAARALVCQRRGNAYDPAVADAFCAFGELLLQRVADAGWANLGCDAETVRRTLKRAGVRLRAPWEQ